MMERREAEVADIFREYGTAYCNDHKLTLQSHKVMNAIIRCRTSVLGGHVDVCDRCGHERNFYNSCRNRHCPKCGSLARERWLLARKYHVLPIVHFHTVFTIPDSLNPVVLQNQRILYSILFRAGSETLLELARDPKHLGAEIGVIATLHTWGQNLMDHPHLHCIVTGGGLSDGGRKWVRTKKTRGEKDFFVHVNVISDLFKKKFIAYLEEAFEAGHLKFTGKIESLNSNKAFNRFKNELYKKKWITYCKKPFSGTEKVLEYLGRYIYRVAISNRRIIKVNDGEVTFKWRDYRDGRVKLMSLNAFEFIRRFLLHILPEGFFKIRYYGILASRNLRTKLKRCKELLGISENYDQTNPAEIDWQDLFFSLTGIDLRVCPVCNEGRMIPKAMILSHNHSPP